MAQRTRTRRKPSATDTREQLLEAAQEVFESKGFQGATVGAITRAADTAHGTFYLYFRNKEDVFAKVVEGATAELFEEASADWSSDDPRDAIERSLRGFLHLFVRHRALWRCVLEGSFTTPSVEALWLEMRSLFVDRIEAQVRALVEAGAVRPLDPFVTAHALGSMAEWTSTTLFVLESRDIVDATVDDTARTLADLWYHALFAPALPPGGPRTPQGSGHLDR